MGGIVITPNIAAALAGQVAVRLITNSRQSPFLGSTGKPWRPPQWQTKATYMITIPSNAGVDVVNQVSAADNTVSGGAYTLSTPPAQGATLFVFDAMLRARHDQQLRITEHPIQTGANISDHAYLEPFRLSMEIGMSDAMDAYAPGMWVGATSKSVSAYQTLLRLQAARLFLTLTTRLQTYENMLIENISANEEAKSITGLCATISFKQVFTATVAQQTITARPNATNTTQLATVQPQPPAPAVTQQYAVTPPVTPVISGAGLWNSAASYVNSGLSALGIPVTLPGHN